MYPYQRRVFMGYNPQESLENTINTMGTLLGVHPIVPWDIHSCPYFPDDFADSLAQDF